MLQEHRGGSGAKEERSGWERLIDGGREAESKPGGRAHAKAPGQEASWPPLRKPAPLPPWASLTIGEKKQELLIDELLLCATQRRTGKPGG